MRRRGTFFGFAVRLQAEIQLPQQIADDIVSDLVTQGPQCVGQIAQAPAGPQQRRLRIAARRGFDEVLQVAQQRGIDLCRLFPPATRPSHPPGERIASRPLKFVQATPDGASRQDGDAGYRRDATTSRHACLGCGKPPSTPLVQNGGKRRTAKRHGRFIDYTASLRYLRTAPESSKCRKRDSLTYQQGLSLTEGVRVVMPDIDPTHFEAQAACGVAGTSPGDFFPLPLP
jgi:hypothetical protein